MKYLKRIIKAILNPYSLFKPLPHMKGTVKGKEHRNDGVNIIIEEIMEPHIVRMCAELTLKENAKAKHFEGINMFDDIYSECNTNWFKRLFKKPIISKIRIVQRIAYVNKDGAVDMTYPRPSMQMVIDELKKYLDYADIEILEDWIPYQAKRYKL